MALASWAVPNCPCCAIAAAESVTAAADSAPIVSVRIMDDLLVGVCAAGGVRGCRHVGEREPERRQLVQRLLPADGMIAARWPRRKLRHVPLGSWPHDTTLGCPCGR